MRNVCRLIPLGLAAGLMCGVCAAPVSAAEVSSQTVAKANAPWLDPAKSPEARVKAALAQMTPEEMLTLVHGIYPISLPSRDGKGKQIPTDAVGSAGYIYGIPRLGIPSLQETDASLGIANPMSVRPNDIATPLPSSLATAASFDTKIAYAGGALIGNEAHNKGFNVLLAGGVNLARDPRNGRNFEYLGEDPLLAGELDAAHINGIQSEHVISTIKHFAVNDQEHNRTYANSVIDEAAMRESDLYAFEIAIEKSHPGSVMCGYNRVNGPYSCDNAHLLNDILKGDWKYPGWVMSDWGAVHALDYALNGLDQESAVEFDVKPFFRDDLPKAIKDGTFPRSRLEDMAGRVLHSMFAVGVIEHPPVIQSFDVEAHAKAAQRTAEAGIVLLKNEKGALPLAAKAQKIAVIGGKADFGVLSGGGSSQVIPKGSLVMDLDTVLAGLPDRMVYHPSSPIEAIRKLAPQATVKYVDGSYTSEAVRIAKWADVVIVFATKWQTEGKDVPSLALPDNQDTLIDAVAGANAHTVVVLQTGNPVTMPWLAKVRAVMEAWYPGIRGGEAIANVLFGKVNPSGRLPITFPRSLNQLPRKTLPGWDIDRPFFGKNYDEAHAIPVRYTEGADIGYRWFARKNETPLFPFGYGLSYTSFAYSHLKVEGGKTLTVSFDVTNTGKSFGQDAPQVYLKNAAGKKLQRLIGFTKVALQPGETTHVTLQADPRLLADYSVAAHGWQLRAGTYAVALAKSATEAVATGGARVEAATLAP